MVKVNDFRLCNPALSLSVIKTVNLPTFVGVPVIWQVIRGLLLTDCCWQLPKDKSVGNPEAVMVKVSPVFTSVPRIEAE